MTKTEIINNVANFYNLGNRSINHDKSKGSSCLYTDINKNHCAVGRYLKPEFQTMKFSENSSSVTSLYESQPNKGIDYYLISKVHGHNILFWELLQDLHDNKPFWNEKGLSNLGKSRVQDLLNKYKD